MRAKALYLNHLILLLLPGIVLISLSQGSAINGWAGIQDLWQTMLSDQHDTRLGADLYLQLRLPRVLFALIAGAGLAASGVCLQAVLKNSMADPWLLGLSAGASFGAVCSLIFATSLIGILTLPLSAFLGGSLAGWLVYQFADVGKNSHSLKIILTGIAISLIFNGLTQALVLLSSDPSLLRGVLFWTLGSLSGLELSDILVPGIFISLALASLQWRAKDIDLLLLSEAKAFSLGLHVRKLRIHLFLAIAIITACIVSICGAISLIGLLVPHIVRMWMPVSHRQLLPVSMLVGGLTLLMADLLARTLASPQEIPISVVTALLASPVMLLLIRREKNL